MNWKMNEFVDDAIDILMDYNQQDEDDKLVEAVGTLQIGFPKLKIFVDSILSDIENKKYLDDVISVASDYYKDDDILTSVKHFDYFPGGICDSETARSLVDFSSFNVYRLKYENISEKNEIFENLRLILIKKKNQEVQNYNNKGVALLNYPEYAIYGEKVLSGCIVLNLDVSNELLEGCLYHEMNHYYKALKLNVSTDDKINVIKDLRTFFPETAYYEKLLKKFELGIYKSEEKELYDLSKIDIKKLTDNIVDHSVSVDDRIKSAVRLFNLFAYVLSEFELAGFLENVVSDYKRYLNSGLTGKLSFENLELCKQSSVLNFYKKIDTFLNTVEMNPMSFDTDENFLDKFNEKYSIHFARLFKRFDRELSEEEIISKLKNKGFNKIIKIYKKKIKSFSKHFNAIEKAFT